MSLSNGEIPNVLEESSGLLFFKNKRFKQDPNDFQPIYVRGHIPK